VEPARTVTRAAAPGVALNRAQTAAADALHRRALAHGTTPEALLAKWAAADGPATDGPAVTGEALVLLPGYLEALARLAAACGMTPSALVCSWIDNPPPAPVRPGERSARAIPATLAAAPAGALDRLMASVERYDTQRAPAAPQIVHARR
jgi:aryl-alcohol dehydrogenase-like predicted oxidoreductase